MIRRMFWRVRWVFLGEVAQIACEYDDTSDALIIPIMSGLLATTLWFAASEAFRLGTPSGFILTLCASLYGVVLTGLAIVSTVATVVYATQPTELPAGEEVVRR